MIDYLLDKEFLEKLHLSKNRTVYAKVTLLSYAEHPLEEIQGLVTGGSINIDGESSLRRTCSLSMEVPNTYGENRVPINFNSKFQLSIGLKNEINNNYPEIIWFNQGMYIVTNLNVSYSEQKISLSLTGKDKMCLLNGEIGGQFYSQTKLDTLEVEDSDKNITFQKIPIKEIIYNLLYEMGHELPYNIIISDLDDYGYELWEYRGEKPLYIVYKKMESGDYIPYNFTQDEELAWGVCDEEYVYSDFGDFESETEASRKAYILTAGKIAGYHQTQLIYPSDLVANVGESVVTILDKIKSLLGTFEYFYDLDGHFVFQKKKQYIAENTDNLVNYSFDIINNLQFEDLFNSDVLIKSIAPSSKLTDIKNDFAIWGTRESVSGAAIDIHARVAIDLRPQTYTSIEVTEEDIDFLRSLYPDQYPLDNKFYVQEEREWTAEDYDWREIIYQMANDYFKYHLLDDFYYRVEQTNPQYAKGITGYEQYYSDVYGFWRQLYDIEKTPGYTLASSSRTVTLDYETKCYVFADDGEKVYYKNPYYDPYDEFNDVEYLPLEVTSTIWESYYLEEENEEEFKSICELSHAQFNEQKEEFYKKYNQDFIEKYLEKQLLNLYTQVQNYNDDYWHKNVKDNPSLLNFWIDFIEPNGDLEQFGISLIGDRTYFKSDKDANILLTERTPEIQFQPTDEVRVEQGSFDLDMLQVPPNIRDMFVIASQKTSVISKINELINTHTQLVTGISITALPVYYLQPNKMIYINNTSSKVEGNFNISKITIPLTYNGTMTITGSKILEYTMEVQER